jgi:hypothetical protein
VGTIDGAPMLYERHLATQIMLWLVLVYVSWCAVIATRKQRAPAMTETIVHVFGDHTRHCNTHKYILREVPVGLYIVSYRTIPSPITKSRRNVERHEYGPS